MGNDLVEVTPAPEMVAMAERIADEQRPHDSVSWLIANNAALTAIMETTENGDEWRPIDENTPRGRKEYILVWNGKKQHVASFDPVDMGWSHSMRSVVKTFPVNPKPTHWKPLGPPPSARG